MFGGRKRRVEKLSVGAARHLEAGESVQELVQVQTGQSAAANAAAVMTSYTVSARTGRLYRAEVNAGPHVLVATDRNLYAMSLAGARLLDVGEVVMKAPLDEADLRREDRRLIFGGTEFHIMALFGDHADRLYDYVSGSSAPTA